MFRMTDENGTPIKEIVDTLSYKYTIPSNISGQANYPIWKGDDLDSCLKHVKDTSGKIDFDMTVDSTRVPLTVGEKESRHTLVNHPPHYNKHPSGIECIEITRHMNFNLGNAMKYIWRADLKNDAIEDLEKAAWYIQDEIKRREKK